MKSLFDKNPLMLRFPVELKTSDVNDKQQRNFSNP